MLSTPSWPLPPPLYCCRFSPLWQPAGQALAEALTQNPNTAWSIILQHITQTQQQFLAGNNGHSWCSGADHPQQQQQHLGDGNGSSSSFDLQQQYHNFCQQGYGVAAAASSTCTDAANRLTHVLKGLAGTTSPGVLHQVSDDWVPLLLSSAAAVTQASSSEDDGADQDGEAAAAEGQQQLKGDVTQQPATAAGAKRKQPESETASAAEPQQQQQQQRPGKRLKGGLGAAVSREGLGGLGFSLKSWRGVMMEWLGLLGALRNPQKLKRWVGGDLVGVTI